MNGPNSWPLGYLGPYCETQSFLSCFTSDGIKKGGLCFGRFTRNAGIPGEKVSMNSVRNRASLVRPFWNVMPEAREIGNDIAVFVEVF